MVSLTQWTWVWVNSERWWRTGMSGVLQSMRSQTVWCNWVTEQYVSEPYSLLSFSIWLISESIILPISIHIPFYIYLRSHIALFLLQLKMSCLFSTREGNCMYFLKDDWQSEGRAWGTRYIVVAILENKIRCTLCLGRSNFLYYIIIIEIW